MMRSLTVLFLLAAVCVAGCARRSEPPRDNYVYEPVRIAAVYTMLVEKPDAARVLLIGEEACSLTNYFERAGVRPFRSAEGRFDIVAVACREMTDASRDRVCALVKDNGILVWLMDVRDVPMSDFRRRVETFNLPETHLWMTGEHNWLLVGRKTPRRVRLSSALEPFARERAFSDLAAAQCATLPELFANYVGRREDILPAFGGGSAADPPVRPEFFLTTEIPSVNWLDTGGMDADLAQGVLAEIRSMQVVRRIVVEGNMASAAAKERKDEEKATEKWARAALRNPHDLMLLERLDRLDRNARGFLACGKVLLAMKCYETMVIVRPADARAVHNFGMCLKRLGKRDLAEKVLQRAKTLSQ